MPRTPALPCSRPSGTKMLCPISPACPRLPRSKWPSHMMAPPIPVPRVMSTTLLLPDAAPTQTSARRAAFVSFSRTMEARGKPKASASKSQTGTSRQPSKFAATLTTPRRMSNKPGVQTPTPATASMARPASSRAASVNFRTRRATLAGSWSAPRRSHFTCWPGLLSLSEAPRSWPLPSTTPTEMVVPPMSTPRNKRWEPLVLPPPVAAGAHAG
mmetsp:Transcript_47248/g.137509  ORF Transcript_47248/g.137509 Transcript_47248/m.137509 type:complete len:214 (+) Transcript_47248:440-1081(+)